MRVSVTCADCSAIARELAQAYKDTWKSSNSKSKAAWIATYRMIGGTEADVKLAEKLIPVASFQDPSPVQQALRKKWRHQSRTGHKVPRVSEIENRGE